VYNDRRNYGCAFFDPMHRPIIGITQSSQPHYLRTLQNILIREAYNLAIQNAGGIPVKVEPNTPQTSPTHLDGILFSGGGDINPLIYGDMDDEFALGIDDDRDRLELDMLRQAVDNNIPFLGICRGLQLINVALGGNLYRDLSRLRTSSISHDWHPSRKYLAHPVSVVPKSLLDQFGFETNHSVNSLHHQGIRSIGNSLTPIAYASDGLIEAFELTGHPFGLAVQWHPEWLTSQQSARCLFESFIHACEKTPQ
jgi:putative glutamine amidotransferase